MSVSEPQKKTEVVLLATPDDVAAACTNALINIAFVYGENNPSRPHRPDLFVLYLDREQLRRSVEQFAMLRRNYPGVPILLLSQELPYLIAIELMKFGAADLATLPLDGGLLQRQVERIRLGRYVTVLEIADLEPLSPGQEVPSELPKVENRRRCYRVPLPKELPLLVSSAYLPVDVRLVAEDFSVTIEQSLGGMRLRSEPTTVARLLAQGNEVPVRFHLPGEGSPVAGQIQLIRIVTSGAVVRLGVQYRCTNPRDDDKFQRLWMKCQRLNRQ